MNVITIGTFDILHYGHLKLFKKCRELAAGGKVVVGLNSDEFIQKYKEKPPIMKYEERRNTILETGLVDRVVVNEQNDGSIKTALALGEPKLIVIGSDWMRRDYLKQVGLTPQWLDDKGISLCYVPYTWEVSTSEIKKRITAAAKAKTIC